MAREFEFEFQSKFKPILKIFRADPGNSRVVITDDGRLEARFGKVSLETELTNVVGAEKTGPYTWFKAIGVRSSLKDRGITFGSTTAGGVCIRFKEPVKASPPLGPIAHPGLTVTVANRDGLVEALTA